VDKLQLTGQNLGYACAMHLCCHETKLPKLKLKTRHKQLLVSLPLDIALGKVSGPMSNEEKPTLDKSMQDREKYNEGVRYLARDYKVDEDMFSTLS